MANSIELVRQIMDDLIPFNRHLGIRVKELRPGHAALELPFRDEFIGDPVRRVLHGGVLSTLIDTCGGAAVWTQVELEDRVSTVDLRVDYLRPAPGADLVCEGTVQRLGNRVGVVEMRLYSSANPGRLIATGKGVYNIRRGKVERDAG
jgi:uncharacterized protein (TIGR00369 family)